MNHGGVALVTDDPTGATAPAAGEPLLAACEVGPAAGRLALVARLTEAEIAYTQALWKRRDKAPAAAWSNSHPAVAGAAVAGCAL